MQIKWWDMPVSDLKDISFDDIDLAIQELKTKVNIGGQ